MVNPSFKTLMPHFPIAEWWTELDKLAKEHRTDPLRFGWVQPHGADASSMHTALWTALKSTTSDSPDMSRAFSLVGMPTAFGRE